MDADRWGRVKALFHDALAIEPAGRPSFLADACAGEAEPQALRAEVERLLEAHGQAASFIERSPVNNASQQRPSSMTGARVGRYRIGRLLGTGGMGEVYAARDEDLGRDVAVKISSSDDGEAQVRLRREAQHASRLNHPHICTIHEVTVLDGRTLIVMELIEGETLADRIARGPIRPADALPFARQLTEALDAAHAGGLVHRDLKPANIKVRSDGTLKVLDFGLAKTMAVATSAGAAASTVATPSSVALTAPGVIVGTAAYMAPEQVRGEVLDKRVDIWAFGCVLYEMLTGERAFRGGTVTDTMAAVLTAEPAWDRVPAAFRPLVRRCLTRDPSRRLRDIGDALALVDLDARPATTSTTSMWRRSSTWLVAAAALVAAVGVAAYLYSRRSEPARDLVRFDIQRPPDTDVGQFVFAPSPDGRTVAFLGENTKSGKKSLWLYSLAAGVSRELAEMDVAAGNAPFWSPDGRFVAVFADGKLRRVEVANGAVATVCEMPGVTGVGTWSADGVILLGVLTTSGNEGLMKVPSAGGTPVLVTRVDRTHDETGHTNPAFLPDGRHFLYQRLHGGGSSTDVYVGRVDARPEEQVSTPAITLAVGRVTYAASDERVGYVLFMRQNKLMAQRFDNRQLQPIGDAVPVPGQPSTEIASREVAASSTVLAYRRLTQPDGVLAWVDRSGREEPMLRGEILKGADFPRLSPDGRRVAIVVNGDIWIYDRDGKPPLRLTSSGAAFAPLWTRDGRRLVYESTQPGLQSIAADGSDQEPHPAASPSGHYHPFGWVGNDSTLLTVAFRGPVPSIVTLSPDGRQSGPLVPPSGRTGENGVALSPDGKLLAYASDITGREEIWVRAYPAGAPVRVSANGGLEPVWARDGRELFYREGRRMMAARIDNASGFAVQPAATLFEGTYLRNGQPPSYDVAPDGRFLLIKPVGEVSAPITAVLNWTQALQAQVPLP